MCGAQTEVWVVEEDEEPIVMFCTRDKRHTGPHWATVTWEQE